MLDIEGHDGRQGDADKKRATSFRLADLRWPLLVVLGVLLSIGYYGGLLWAVIWLVHTVIVR